MPLDKKLSLNIKMDSHLIAMQEIEVLDLDQPFYSQNIEKFGPDLGKLKHLSIDHRNGTDIELFKAVNRLPGLHILESFKVFNKLPPSGSRSYSATLLIQTWL